MIDIEYERPDTTKKVLEKLRRDIILYKFKDGEQIKEIELAAKYECSRASIRGAIVMLQREGLIKIHKNGTKSVKCLSKQDVDDIYELREYVELSAVKRIAKNKKRDFSAIFDVINSVYTGGRETHDQLDLDMAFHTAVIAASENRALLQAWNNIANITREVFSLNMTESADYKTWFSQTFQERHIGLMSALFSIEDSAEALSLFKSHIDEAHEISTRALKKYAEGGQVDENFFG